MPCKPPPLGHSFKPTEEFTSENAGPDQRASFRIYRCECGERYGKFERFEKRDDKTSR